MPVNSPPLPPEPWLAFLSKLDESAEEAIDFHCLGGFVVAFAYGLARTTADVDVLSFVPQTEAARLVGLGQKQSALHELYKVYIDPVTIVMPPEDYDRWLVEMFPGAFKNIRLFALDVYDIALTKIGRNSPKDRAGGELPRSDDSVRFKHSARALPERAEGLFVRPRKRRFKPKIVDRNDRRGMRAIIQKHFFLRLKLKRIAGQ